MVYYANARVVFEYVLAALSVTVDRDSDTNTTTTWNQFVKPFDNALYCALAKGALAKGDEAAAARRAARRGRGRVLHDAADAARGAEGRQEVARAVREYMASCKSAATSFCSTSRSSRRRRHDSGYRE